MCRWASSSRARRRRSLRRTAASRLPSSGASGLQQRGEGRHLDRQVLARDAPGAVGFQQRALGELAIDLDEPVERLAAARGVAVGLGARDRRLAEQVDARGDAVLPELLEHAGRLARRLADDEAVGHVLDARRGGRAQGLAPGPRLRHAHRDLQRRRAVVDLLEEPAEVAREVVERAARGDDVDEAEQGCAQVGVLRGEVHRLVVHRLQRVAARPRQRRGEIAPDGDDVGFRGRGACHGRDDIGRGARAAIRDGHRGV